MGAPRLGIAQQIVDQVRAAIAAAATDDDALTNVIVTKDPLIVPQAAPNGVVVVTPPTLTFETFDQFGATWTLEVISGPIQHMEVAWDRADRIIEAIRTRTGLPITGAVSGNYTPAGGATYLAGYLLTIEDDYIITED
jgi:hypothetical protein